jgi:hypothetical protein
MLTEPKTALAGVILEISFARFSASMVTFSAERTPFRRFCRWELEVIVQVAVGGRKLCEALADTDERQI